MEVAIGCEALRQQLGADNRAVVEFDEAATGLVREKESGDAGNQQRITQAQEDGGDESEANRCLPNGMHFVSPSGADDGSPNLASEAKAPLFSAAFRHD